MADKVWVGTNADWTDDNNWSPANQPVDGDSVFFTGDSNQSVDGLTLGTANDALVDFVVHEDYAGSLGSSGSPIVTSTITTLRFNSRSGRLYLDSGANAITTAIFQAASGRSDALTLDGTVTNFRTSGASGGVTLVSGAAITNVDMESSPNLTVTAQASITGLTTVEVGSGVLDLSSAVTALTVHGGRVIRRSSGAITTLKLYGKGASAVCEDLGSGTIGLLRVAGRGAIFDGRGNRQTGITITNSRGFDGGRVLLKNAMDSYTLTNAFLNHGAVIDFETGGGVAKG